MFRLERFLTWAGSTFCAFGAIFGLISHFQKRDARYLQTATYIDNLADIKQLIGLVPIFIAVTGRVFSQKPIKCDLSDQDAVIIRLTEDKKSETRALNIWVPENDRLREVVRETDWALTQTTDDGSTIQLPVLDGRRATGDFMQLSADIFTPSHTGALEQVLGQLAGHKSVGIQHTEHYLPQEAVITAIGELTTSLEHPDAFKHTTKTPKGNDIYVLKAPQKGHLILSRRRLPELISSAQMASAVYAGIATWCTAIGASMLFLVVSQKAYVKYREYVVRARVEERRKRRIAAPGKDKNNSSRDGIIESNNGTTRNDSSSAAATVDSDVENDGGRRLRGTCVVCLDKKSDFVYPQCGHLCLCKGCLHAGASIQKCPICRSRGPPIRVYTT